MQNNQQQSQRVTEKKPVGEGSVVQDVVKKVKEAENVLVALSNNPSVDEMAAAIGLTLLLESIEKHATAIYSGKTPNVLEFLKPEETFEMNTNGLQDFIIALDKEKADHLRYKVDGDFVKVYITPYKTTLSEGDLAFSRGDFNVDLVISLNVPAATELDAALREYGRIMHDATAINITNGAAGKFGDVEWVDAKASSVSEMVAELALELRKDLDQSIATALLTGIVAATDKFGNQATTPEVMMLAAKLMKFGANQQEVFRNISQELEFVEREAAGAEVEQAPNELQGEIFRTRGEASTETVGGEVNTGATGDAEEGGGVSEEEGGMIEEIGEAEAEKGVESAAIEEGAGAGEVSEEETGTSKTQDVIVVPDGETGESAKGEESLADQILNKIQARKEEDEKQDEMEVSAGPEPDYGQMIDRVSAEPMPGEVVPGMPMGTMPMGGGGQTATAQEEMEAMNTIRQANTNPSFPEGMELPSVIPGGGSSVNPSSMPIETPAPVMAGQAMAGQGMMNPAMVATPEVAGASGEATGAEVPMMDLRPVGSGEGMSSNTGGEVAGRETGSVLPMPGEGLGVPPTPPMPDFSTMPVVEGMSAETLGGPSADVPAGMQAMSPAGVPMGSMPGVEPSVAQAPDDPSKFQIPPVAF